MKEEFRVERYNRGIHFCIKRNGGGVLPSILTGLFTSESAGEAAIAKYMKLRTPKVDLTPVSTPLIELDKLSKKEPLLEFAKIFEIDVPDSMKQPASIKKLIKDELEARGEE